MIGQERALASVRFGVGIRQEGYNLFALGPNGIGKYTAVSQLITQKAASEPVPPDWCSVHDFEQPHRPNALQLPPGKGSALAHDMETLVKELFAVLPTAFESEDYQRRKKVLEEEYRETTSFCKWFLSLKILISFAECWVNSALRIPEEIMG